MSRSFVRTVVLDVSAFAADIKVDEGTSKIGACFEEGEVVFVQFMPAKSVCVTFSSEALKCVVLNSPTLAVDGVDSPVRGGGPRPENVLIYRFPHEADVEDLKTVLSHGGVHDVHYRAWVHLNDVIDGSCVVRMTRSMAIPRSILMNGLQCKAWYRGMPVTCDICGGSYKAQDCGHIQLFFPLSPNAWGTAVDNPILPRLMLPMPCLLLMHLPRLLLLLLQLLPLPLFLPSRLLPLLQLHQSPLPTLAFLPFPFLIVTPRTRSLLLAK